jgi:hypothetical protein
MKRKTLQRVAHLGQKKLIYNALHFCYEEKKNGRFIIPLETATARASKATGICEWTVKNAERSEVCTKTFSMDASKNICAQKMLITL